MKIILGSTSPHRRKVLEESSFEFEVITEPIDEKAIRSDSIEELPQILARAKMEALRPKVANQSCIVVTADQVARCDGRLFEKPETEEEFRERIPLFEKYGVDLISAMCVFNPENGKEATDFEICHVSFGSITEQHIVQALAAGDWKTCCAFNDTLRELCALDPFSRTDSVKGLPLNLMTNLIQKVS